MLNRTSSQIIVRKWRIADRRELTIRPDNVSGAPAPTTALTYAQEVMVDLPSGYWRLNEAAGATTVADSSGNGLTGTVNGGVTFGGEAIVAGGKSAAFNGTTGYISVPHDLRLTPGGAGNTALADFTVECWIKGVSATSEVPLVEKFGTAGGAGFVGFLFDLNGSGVAGVPDLWTGSAWTGGFPSTVNDRREHHIVAMLVGTTTQIFIDGVLVKTNTGVTANLGGSNAFHALEIGRRYDFSLFLSGSLAEVAFYNHSFSPERVLRHYQARNC